jgi:hypothetical protein
MSYKQATIGLAVVLSVTYVLIAVMLFLAVPQLRATRRLGAAMQQAAENDSLCASPGIECEFAPDPAIQPPVTSDVLAATGAYNVTFAAFAAQAVGVLEQAVLESATPAPLANTRVLGMFSGAGSNSNTKRLHNMVWVLQPLSQPGQLWVAFRGTQTKAEWEIDFDTDLVPLSATAPTATDVLVHNGFLQATNELAPQVLSLLKPLVQAAPPTHVFVCGHSLGASLAILTSLFLVQHGVQNVHTYVFAPPRVGSDAFTKLFLSLIPSQLKEFHALANVADIVPQLPLSVMPNLNNPKEPFLYAQFPLLMFQDNWGSWIHNHIMPVYVANVANVSPVPCAPPTSANQRIAALLARGRGGASAAHSLGSTRRRGRTSALLRKFLFSF